MIQRYEPDVEYIGCGDYVPDMKPDPDGEYVLEADHAQLVALVREYGQARAECDNHQGCDEVSNYEAYQKKLFRQIAAEDALYKQARKELG